MGRSLRHNGEQGSTGLVLQQRCGKLISGVCESLAHQPEQVLLGMKARPGFQSPSPGPI